MHFHENVYQKLSAFHVLLAGPQFMTYNVHQLLHLRACVEDLGPLWSYSCFFFEDLNRDFRDLFHGTQNIDGQVCVIIINNKIIVYISVDMNEKFVVK